MNALLQIDRTNRPDLFNFHRPIPPEELDVWLNEHGYMVPNDLKQFWCETGGGELFESETILSPFGRTDLADDVDSVNQFHRERGMPAEWVIFHTGIGGFSVVQAGSGNYKSIREGDYVVQQSFTSLADWYANLIRREYAPHYNLPD